jgi:hypothetical protein
MPMRHLVVAAVSVCLFGQSITRSRIAGGLEAIRVGELKTGISYLASEKLQGRLSLTPGSDLAIRWVEQQFRASGLKPAGERGSYLQPVPLIESRPDREHSSLTVRFGSESKTYRYPDAYGSFPSNISAGGEVVFAGFGITAPELNYDDYAGIDARGKIVLIFDHEPQENDAASPFNGKGNTLHAGLYMKTLNAQRHGAVALVVVSEPNRKHPSNQERLARIRGMDQRARIPSQALADSDLKIPSMTVNDAIAGEMLGGKARELQSAIDSTLKPASRPLPGVSAHLALANSERRAATSYNVLGLLPGGDPNLAADTILYTAHYDHDGPAPDGKFYPGADDDASGTVGVVELARAFSKNPVRPRRSILFAVFAAEERGLLGSYYYAAHPVRPLVATRAVINFDMIGRDEKPSPQTDGLIEIAPDTSNELNLVGTNYSPEYKALVERANNSVGLRLSYKWDEEPALNVFFRSDHYPFAAKGVPALWWFTGFHPDYHQTTDTADRIDYEKMAKILRLAFITGFDLAEMPQPPKFKP